MKKKEIFAFPCVLSAVLGDTTGHSSLFPICKGQPLILLRIIHIGYGPNKYLIFTMIWPNKSEFHILLNFWKWILVVQCNPCNLSPKCQIKNNPHSLPFCSKQHWMIDLPVTSRLSHTVLVFIWNIYDDILSEIHVIIYYLKYMW